MANKITNKSQEQSMKIAVQSQLARIKKEDEEELWISGEELYTEGSSDEEEYKTQSCSRRKVNSNQSSRAVSTTRSDVRRGLSPNFAEIKAKLEHSEDTIDKEKNVAINSSTLDKGTRENVGSTASTMSQSTERLTTDESSETLITRHSFDYSTEEEQAENREISWKAKREWPYDDEESFEDETDDDIDILSIDADVECLGREILEVRSLDNLIRAISEKVKKANEETLFQQCENRKRLDNIVRLSPSETPKLARNTRQFFYLYPGYRTLSAEFEECRESCSSLQLSDSQQQIFSSDENLSLDAKCSENEEVLDLNSNPYHINTEITDILQTVEEEQVFQLNLYNEQEQCLEKFDTVPYASSTISILDTPMTISSQDIDEYVAGETISKVDKSSTVDIND